MKKITLAFVLVIVVLCLVTVLPQSTVNAATPDIENRIVLCDQEGNVIEVLSAIVRVPFSNNAVTLPVPQVGNLVVTERWLQYRVTQVIYIYGSNSVYTIKLLSVRE